MGKQGQVFPAGAQSTAGRSAQLTSVRFMAAPTLIGFSNGKMLSFGTFISSLLASVRASRQRSRTTSMDGGFFSAISHCAILIHHFIQMDYDHLSADWSIVGPILLFKRYSHLLVPYIRTDY
jgi:hypothetical protein